MRKRKEGLVILFVDFMATFDLLDKGKVVGGNEGECNRRFSKEMCGSVEENKEENKGGRKRKRRSKSLDGEGNNTKLYKS